ncbi:MAG: hypothetical protein BWY73_01437 [candidate division TA06 bacterium ADurb.Bin417]|uniref:Uncharacterized protein n=1 Tax=candidate division TA06 bacterium ADurb.Bin417 TaxID=1852828 RepID=A0A1V5M9B7_UNCT6|nr:MAG: hypothetical protein BWY73_01437 [candidate division TA06 bacterium ADurb.Bin417]
MDKLEEMVESWLRKAADEARQNRPAASLVPEVISRLEKQRRRARVLTLQAALLLVLVAWIGVTVNLLSISTEPRLNALKFFLLSLLLGAGGLLLLLPDRAARVDRRLVCRLLPGSRAAVNETGEMAWFRIQGFFLLFLATLIARVLN